MSWKTDEWTLLEFVVAVTSVTLFSIFFSFSGIELNFARHVNYSIILSFHYTRDIVVEEPNSSQERKQRERFQWTYCVLKGNDIRKNHDLLRNAHQVT